MDLALKTIVPLGGAAVLGSYAWGLTRRDISGAELWGPLTGRVKVFWTVSAGLTAAAFLYLWWLWAFDQTLDGTRMDATLLIVSVFLLSAVLWMVLVVLYKRHVVPRWSITANLWVTAAASVGLMVLSDMEHNATWKNKVAVGAGTMLVIQHVFWDAILWDSGFK
jgi:hypothetical protein